MNIQDLGLFSSPALSLNLPLVAMARRKTLHSCLVQLLLPSLLPQLPPPAQAGLRLLRLSVSTHLQLLVRIQHRRGKDPCWTGNQSTATTPLGMSKAFFPRCSPANWVSESSSKGEKFQISIGKWEPSQTPLIHPHSPSHWHLTQRGCRC